MKILKIVSIALFVVLVVFLQFYGINSLVLNSDELHPARTLVSDDWSLVDYPWPEEATREFFNDWPIQFPPLFGLAVRLAVVLFGSNHFALRFFPAFFAVLAVGASFLLYRLFVSTPWAFTGAVIMGVMSDKLMWYAKCLKHYTADVLFTVLLLYFGKMALDRNRILYWILFSVTASVAIWVAFGSVFVAGAVFVAVFYKWIVLDHQSGGWKKIISGGLLFACSLAALYFINISKAVSNPVFLQAWDLQTFVGSRASDFGYLLRFFLHKGYHILLLPYYFFEDNYAFAVPANLCIIIYFVYAVKKRQWTNLKLFLLPLVFVLLLSTMGKYPFSAGRLSLFLLPIWILLILLGLRQVFRYLYRRNKYLLYAVTSICVALSLFLVYTNVVKVSHQKYAGGRRVDQMIFALKENARDQDTVFLHWGAILPFYFYYTDHKPGYQKQYPVDHLGTINVIYGEEHTLFPQNEEAQFERVVNVPGRLWIVFGHLWPSDDMKKLVDMLDNRRVRLQKFEFKGCVLFLYD
ncbi:glycosyltransferase family 39 protein [candidate division KSB1 bacterium]|nr:glycosyltransferase family 39 protein [candidate division KSB1 bacterium]